MSTECESGKQSFATPGEAQRMVRVLTKRTSLRSHAARKNWCSGQLKHYQCPICKQWHVGHTKPAQPKDNAA